MSKHHQRGFTMVEALVGLAVAPLLVGLHAMAPEEPAREEVLLEARELRARAEAHLRATGRCPLPEDLAIWFVVATDAWDKPFWFLCRDGRVTVISDGPDGAPFTRDDLGDPRLAWEPPRGRR